MKSEMTAGTLVSNPATEAMPTTTDQASSNSPLHALTGEYLAYVAMLVYGGENKQDDS